MKIDSHNHFIPHDLIKLMRNHSHKLNTEIIKSNGTEFISHFEGFSYPLFEEFYDYDVKIKDMERMGFDKVILSVAPSIFYYWLKTDMAIQTSRLCNDWVSDLIKDYPQRFGGMATLPMQNIKASLKELERAHCQLGLNAVELAPVILDRNLDDPEFDLIFSMAEECNILVYLHPYYTGIKPPYDKYYETNLISNIVETTMGISRLIFGGVFERHPYLKVLTSHGGGFFPYQQGRFMHGFNVRSETRENITKLPDIYLKNIYFDCITHWIPSLKFLIDNFGTDHIVLGTDYPYDMGDFNPIAKFDDLGLKEIDKNRIFYQNITDLMAVKNQGKKI